MKKLTVIVALLVACLTVHAKDTRIENLTSDAYQKKFEELMRKGLRPVKVSIQSTSGEHGRQEARFGATFRKVKDSPAWAARHGLDATAYQAEFDKLVAEGYMPTDISTACVNQQVLYSVTFEKIPEAKPWFALHNIFDDQFDDANQQLLAKGAKLKLHVQCETAIGSVHAAVWQKE